MIRRISYSNQSSGKGINVVFTDGSELLVSNVDSKLAGQVLSYGKIVESAGGKIIVASAIDEGNFLPRGECHFFSSCGGIEWLPGVSKDMWRYLLLSSSQEIGIILDHRLQKERKIDPKIIGL